MNAGSEVGGRLKITMGPQRKRLLYRRGGRVGDTYDIDVGGSSDW